jgi:hypothetical protein
MAAGGGSKEYRSSMDIERSLLAKAFNSGELENVIARGIDPDHFADLECKEVYEFGMEFMRAHKATPSLRIVRDEFPDFAPPISKDPLSYHLERFIHWVKERKAVELVRGFHDAIEDPDQVKEIELVALEMARTLAEVVPAPRASRFSEGMRRKSDYERKKATGEFPGIYLGIPTIDKIMEGLQPHELAVIAAYFGKGKSLLMAYIAYSAYLEGKSSIIISLEMEADAILRRLDVMASHVKYHALKALELDVGEKEQWERILEQAEKDRHERDIIVRDDIHNCTVDKVMAETIRYKPDVVFVDYLELMSSPARSGALWERVNSNAVGLKQNARIMRIPHITAAQLDRQAGKGEVTLSNVSHQSIGKTADVLLGLSQDEEQEMRNELDVLLLKYRDGRRGSATMRWDLDRMLIGEKGVEERFPSRRTKPLIGSERRKKQRLEIARTVGEAGRDNPFGRKSNPFAKREA